LNQNQILRKIRISQAQIILIGEQHTPDYLNKHLELLPAIKAQHPNLKVLFVEFPSVDAIVQIRAVIDGRTKDINLNLLTFEPLIRLASNLGLQVIPIDANWTWNPTARNWKNDFQITDEILRLPSSEVSRLIQENAPRVLSTKGQNDRNETMAKLIQKTLSEAGGTGVFIVGTDHLTTFPSTVNRSQLKRVPERLLEAGISFILF
jgi:hypothetical protein